MLNLKKFKPGEEVYILTKNFGRNKEPEISERTVKSVGYKYVTLNGGWEEKFCIPYMSTVDISYLEEVKDWGEKSLLFKNRQDADDYLERKQIEQWLLRLSPRETDNLSLKQLRKIRDIFDNRESDDIHAEINVPNLHEANIGYIKEESIQIPQSLKGCYYMDKGNLKKVISDPDPAWGIYVVEDSMTGETHLSSRLFILKYLITQEKAKELLQKLNKTKQGEDYV